VCALNEKVLASVSDDMCRLRRVRVERSLVVVPAR